MILPTHALASWLRSIDVDPSDVTLVLRARTRETEVKLMHVLASIFLEHAKNPAPVRETTYPTARPYHLKISGIDVLITSLDTSARTVDG